MSLLAVPPLDEVPWPSLGGQVCDLIEDRAVFGPGSLKGDPAVLDDEKRAIIWRAYEVFPKGHPRAGRRRFRRVGVSLAKGSSKALALDTPLPSPSGWTTMGGVQVGDQLFDERGAPCNVVAVSDVFLGSTCFEVAFKDRSRIVADADHVWWTEELRHKYCGSLKTTKELAGSVSVRADGARNHRIPVAGPLQLPDVDLPVDPWILGAWLGDGRTDDAEFTMHADDHPHFVERVAAAGYFTTTPKVDRRRPSTLAVRVSLSPVSRHGPRYRRTLVGLLREQGLLGNKHVPDVYLRAGYGQRLALLQGLMDTDGSIDAKGNSGSFVSTLEVLARQVYELTAGLGLKPTMCGPRETGAKPAWQVYFHPRADVPLFSLPRKLSRQKTMTSRTAMCTNRHIVGVREVPSVPTRCVAVDSPSRLYLAGEAMVPTHNTELLGWVAFAELHPEGPVRFDGWDADGQPVGRPVRDPYIPMVGVTEEATEELAYGVLYVVCAEGEDADVFDVGLDRIIRVDARGRPDGKATAVAAAPNARDGARTTHQCFDETHRLYLPNYLKAHQTMLGNLTKRPLDDPWHMEVTTAGELGQGSIGEKTHLEALKIAEGEYVDPDIYYHHRQAADDIRMADDRGRLASLAVRTQAVADARGGVGEYAPGQFEEIARSWERPGADRGYLERVWLNRWVKSEQQAFSPAAWKAARAATAEQELRLVPGELVVVGFDGARFRDSTALVVCDVVTGVLDLAGLWERPLDLPDEAEWEVPEQEVTDRLADIFRTYQVWMVYADPPYWTDTVGSWSVRWPDKVEEWWTNRFSAVGHANREFVEALGDGSLRPGDGPLADDLERHVAGAGKAPLQMWMPDGRQLFRLQKLHPDRKIDGAVAATLAWQARLEAIRKGAKKKVLTAPRRLR